MIQITARCEGENINYRIETDDEPTNYELIGIAQGLRNAILECGLQGDKVEEACLDILTGKVNFGHCED